MRVPFRKGSQKKEKVLPPAVRVRSVCFSATVSTVLSACLTVASVFFRTGQQFHKGEGKGAEEDAQKTCLTVESPMKTTFLPSRHCPTCFGE